MSVATNTRTQRVLVVNSRGYTCRTCGELHAFFTRTMPNGVCGIPVSWLPEESFVDGQRTVPAPQNDLPRAEEAYGW